MYYIIEHQHRPDGIVNTTETARENINSALSLYHERFAKMAMTELYTSVALLLVDENLNKVEHHIVQTMYHEPEVEEIPVEEEAEVAR